MIENEQARWN